MKRLVLAAFAAALFVVAAPLMALASDAIPETVAQATSDGTKLTIAWGSLVQTWAGAVSSVMIAGLLFAARQLPANVIAIIGNARVETLVTNAVNYAVNATAGAAKNKMLTINAGNEVVAKALAYTLANASSWLQWWAGGPEGLAKKILARLTLDDQASDKQLDAIVDQAVASRA